MTDLALKMVDFLLKTMDLIREQDAKRENFKQMKWKEKHGQARYGINMAKKKSHNRYKLNGHNRR